MDVSEKIVGFLPKSSILIGVFHYKPSILGYPYFWKHPNRFDTPKLRWVRLEIKCIPKNGRDFFGYLAGKLHLGYAYSIGKNGSKLGYQRNTPQNVSLN